MGRVALTSPLRDVAVTASADPLGSVSVSLSSYLGSGKPWRERRRDNSKVEGDLVGVGRLVSAIPATACATVSRYMTVSRL